MRVEWAGEELELLADRAVWWAREGTLFVADMHLGKAATFRSVGVPVPGGTTAADMGRLDGLVRRCSARRLVVLGDLLHAPAGRAPETMETVRAWRAGHAELEVVLVRGNHDRRAGDPPVEWGVECVDGPHEAGPFALVHEPRRIASGKLMMGAHLHPGVTLQRADGRAGGMRERCFWLRGVGDAPFLILPAFGAMTGIRAVRPRVGDRVFVAGAQEVVEVPGIVG